ncbi:hypothetical protein DXG03_000949 [Asterophora parasitica]|uniref:Uncharacterized protein n=1 Tax=Asterophora parasitica TaxID=117018 RepID=A0A9P7K8P7_9AGAR|nr:hypothetical protein DXG03_000949 [Asterophora parasitica]
MGTPWMLPSSWQELTRADTRAKAAGNAVASGSGSKHQPQTLVGVMIDQKHAVTHETGKTGVGPAADKHCQMNTFGVDRKSTGEVEVEVVSPATKAKGRTHQLTVATCKVLSNVVVEDSESDGGVEVVLGPSKAVDIVDPAAFSFLAPNREKCKYCVEKGVSCLYTVWSCICFWCWQLQQKCTKLDALLTWAMVVARMQKDSTDVPPVPMAIKREVRHMPPVAPFSAGMSSSCNHVLLPIDQAACTGAILSELLDTVAHQPANI